MANGKIETYEEAARSIEVNLKEFCDGKKPYPEMISDAAREMKNDWLMQAYIIEQINRVLAGEEISDFAESFPIIRKVKEYMEIALDHPMML